MTSYSSSSRAPKRSGSEGTLSQHLFLLYDTERALSVDQEGLFDQEDPYEGAAAVTRLASTTSWTSILPMNTPPISVERLVDETRGATDLLSEL
jgi:hypothetical protein